MTFFMRDVYAPKFWSELIEKRVLSVDRAPPPDVIHISPPCRGYSHLEAMNEKGRPLVWHIKNVPESEPSVSVKLFIALAYAGRWRMAGLRVFHH